MKHGVAFLVVVVTVVVVMCYCIHRFFDSVRELINRYWSWEALLKAVNQGELIVILIIVSVFAALILSVLADLSLVESKRCLDPRHPLA